MFTIGDIVRIKDTNRKSIITNINTYPGDNILEYKVECLTTGLIEYILDSEYLLEHYRLTVV